MNTSESPTSAKPGSRRPFYCCLFSRRALLGLGILLTVIGLFYTEENWRGRRAWEQYKQEFEGTGETVDWSAYIPPPVPDEQNIFKAPRMQEWFVGRGATELDKRWGEIEKQLWQTDQQKVSAGRPHNPLLVAELTVVTNGSGLAGNGSNAVWRMGDPATPRLAEKLVQDTVGPSAVGASGPVFIARPLDQIKLVKVLLLAGTLPTAAEIAALFPSNAIPARTIPPYTAGRLNVEADSGNTFTVTMDDPDAWAAADYLAMSDQFEPDLAIIRDALKRPFARPEGDYLNPTNVPVPNFMEIRLVAQRLAQRAQCHLLLGQPDAALSDLTLFHDLSRMLKGGPTGKPMILVSAMINVAITGLYEDVVSDGLRMHSWSEPQLAILERQLGEVDLPPELTASLRSERAVVCRLLESTKLTTLAKLWHLRRGDLPWWRKIVDPQVLLYASLPRGWVYQNMVAHGRLMGMAIENWATNGGGFAPRQVAEHFREVETSLAHPTAYTFLTAFTMPNYARAGEATAFNQSDAEETRVVCALERYRLVNGAYPAKLDALVPRFIEALPRDIIGGKPLIYRTTADGRFTLYSIGWNEQDDGGVSVRDKNGSPVYEQGDWVWPKNCP